MAFLLNVFEMIWILTVTLATCVVWTLLLIKLQEARRRYGSFRDLYKVVATFEEEDSDNDTTTQKESYQQEDIFQRVPSAVV